MTKTKREDSRKGMYYVEPKGVYNPKPKGLYKARRIRPDSEDEMAEG